MDNPYDAPASSLEENDAPALWNPNAAASWCLLFSMAFGAYLHMKNWEALGEPKKAAVSKIWFYIGIAEFVIYLLFFFLGTLANGIDSLLNFASFILLISWYFASAKSQAEHVKSRFRDVYSRKSWGLPILAGIGGWVAFVIVAMLARLVGAVILGDGLAG